MGYGVRPANGPAGKRAPRCVGRGCRPLSSTVAQPLAAPAEATLVYCAGWPRSPAAVAWHPAGPD
eukprot:4299544-Lingulodinium_polyedra.AAC.1